ncbi:hypothetical protein [Streptomyces hokutonensis]|uniref:hypothetical protein n=1 Tax=Streptomyces hokutonensis TaxID=1306990 RepID=UPI0034009FC5
MSDDRGEIARLCENLPWLRDAARAAGLGERLEAAVAVAAAGRTEGVTAIMRRLDLPEAPEVRAPGGIVYPATSEERYGVEAYVCPGGVCDRTWVRPPGVRVTVCAVRGAKMRRQRST